MTPLFNTGILLRLKRLVKKLPVVLTRNQQYDSQTKQIIRKVCTAQSNTVDVGTHHGDLLDVLLQQSPNGTHYGFEPLPVFYQSLRLKYQQQNNIVLYDLALSDINGNSSFNHVTSNPSYSGIKKRNYDRSNETDETIEVKTARLDDVLLSQNKKISFIKIDVEGAELGVLKGAAELIRRDRPVIVFECGLGGSDVYDTTPAELFTFFADLGYTISLLKNYLKEEQALSKTSFEEQYYQKLNYYFVALP
ncbi:FkbM family methyltransferase [Lacibacter sediminis]|uniref:FkbM family methyltransferase n=1 Tax=Lacibacter sediminis TaxID=2760713 RepID=A0A7G5XGB1_9BACT|nr:FkbM family methyltransferase [Lacibacter sediminis]QNA44514.1 FkbM family methyltransferase [Lacibacter sediminis]